MENEQKEKRFFRGYVPASVYSKDEPSLSMHHECYSSSPVQKHSINHLTILDSSKHPRNERMHVGGVLCQIGKLQQPTSPTQNDDPGRSELT